MAKLNLSLKGIELSKPSSGYALVPEGTYKVIVGKTEAKETKSGGGAVILGYQIVEGEHEGKLIKDFINVVNANPEASRIGMQRLATVAFATGFKGTEIGDSDELVNLEPFEVVVAVKDDGEYKNNNVKAILVLRDVSAKPAPAKAATKKPWA
jgi:hypothetical protein